MTGSRHLIELERRLSVHLAILARMNTVDGSPDGEDTQRFVHFAVALQTEDEQVILDTCCLALEQLCDDNLTDTPSMMPLPSIRLPLNGCKSSIARCPRHASPFSRSGAGSESNCRPPW
jgi:hypothetical protein